MRFPKRAQLVWLVLVLLAALVTTARPSAYYDDIHYALTYYIARDVGYTPEQAYRIASANVSIDWSDPTEPVQAGMSAIYQLPRAQEPRWRYHAFRNEIRFSDAVGNGRDADAADEMIRGQRTALWDAAIELGNPGIFLHFFHDEVPHAKYGTKAGHWPVTDADDVNKHEGYGLPIGGTTDWLSYWPIETNVKLVEQTATLLTTFMAKVSPKQQPRRLDMASCRALLVALREVNPFPTPLQGKSIDVLRRAKAAGATGVMDTDAAVGFVANQNDLSPAETDNISRQLRGPALAPAIEKVNAAMAGAGMRSDPELPFETIPAEHRQYQYDAFGQLNGREQVNSFVLVGTLKVKVAVSGNGDRPKTMKVAVKMAKTRPDDAEYALGEATVVPGGDPAVLEKMPIGDMLFEVSGDDGARLTLEKHTLSAAEATVTLNVRIGELVLKGHTDEVLSVAISPDADTVASAALDKTLRFWDAYTGELKRTINNPDPLNAIGYLPSGDLVAATGSPAGGFVKIWNAATGRMRETWPGHKTTATALAVSADGALIASGDAGGTVLIWNASSGAITATLKKHVDGVVALAFSPDGRALVSGSADQSLILWDTRSWQPRQTMFEKDGRLVSVAFSRDSKLVADGTQWLKTMPSGLQGIMGSLKLWDAATGQLKRQFPDHGHGVFGLAFSPSADLLAARSYGFTPDMKGFQDQIWIWNPETGTLIDTIVAGNQAKSLAFSADGRTLAAGEYDGTIHVWGFDKVLAKIAGNDNVTTGGTSAAGGTTGFTGPSITDARVIAGGGAAGSGGASGSAGSTNVAVPSLVPAAAATPAAGPPRAPGPGELDQTDGRFAEDRWSVRGPASLDAGALKIDAPPSAARAVQVTASRVLHDDFDLSVSYSLEQYDTRAGYTFEIDIVSHPPNMFMMDLMEMMNLPKLRVGRLGIQGRESSFLQTEADVTTPAVAVAGANGSFRIHRRGDDWTVEQMDELGIWTLVGHLNRRMASSVGIEIVALPTGAAGLKMTMRSLQVTMFGAK